MEYKFNSIRPFIGAKDFDESRNFYTDLGFKESVLAPNMSYFDTGGLGFYLQDAYVKDWVDNSMVFVEVDDVTNFWKGLLAMNLTARYKNAKIVPIRDYDWGRECFVHDPSGMLWHFGEFFNK